MVITGQERDAGLRPLAKTETSDGSFVGVV